MVFDLGFGGSKNKLTPPLGNSSRLPVQVAIYVPSTKEGDKELTPSGFRSRIESERKWMDETFGGDTTIDASGGFTTESGQLIAEEVAIVESSATVEQYRRVREKLAEHIRKRRDQWGQESIGFEIEGQFFLYPEQSFAPKTDLEQKIDVV